MIKVLMMCPPVIQWSPFACKTETTRWGVNTVILLPSVSSVASVTSKAVATTTCKQGGHPVVVWSRPLDGYAIGL